MSPEQATLVTIFTGIAALALLLQSIAFLFISRSMRDMSVKVNRMSTDLSKTIGTLSTKTEELLSIIRGIAERIQTLENHLTATSAIIQKRVLELDSFLEETTEAARQQVLRIQGVVENVSHKVEETFDLIHEGVITPAAELNALIKGIRVGLDFLLRTRKQPARTSHQEDEMFI